MKNMFKEYKDERERLKQIISNLRVEDLQTNMWNYRNAREM